MSIPKKPVPLKVQDENKLAELAAIIGLTIPELLQIEPTMELATNLYTHKDFTLVEFCRSVPTEIMEKIKVPVINERYVHLPFTILKDANK